MFKTTATSELLTINGFSFSPAEAETFKNAVSFAGGMRNFPALPPKIEFGVFAVHFNEDGTLVATAANRPGEIRFDFDTVDRLVLAIDSALGISTDLKILRPTPRPAGGLDMFNNGDIFEGR